MKRIYIFFLALATITIGCTDRDDEVIAVNIRIQNASSITFDEVQVGDQEEVYMNINPDGFSEYQEYELAYQYAYIQITSGEEVFVLQPIDFVGETPLPIGLYTYVLNIDEEGQVLLDFRID